MSKEKEYHGVPYSMCPYGTPIFFLEHGEISGERFGTWEMGIEIYRGPAWSDCGCSARSCNGKRVPHIFFACPYCGAINAEHRYRIGVGKGPLSVICRACYRHLWISLKDWDEKYWIEAMKGEKACGANSKS